MQYRRLFKEDDDFHPADRTPDERDNWLVGKEWYSKAIDAVDNKGNSLGRKSPRDFYSSPAKSQMNYAEAIEEEGNFDKARRAWIKAAEEWRQFGNTLIEHSTGVKLQLGSQPRLEKEVADLRAKLEAHAARRAREIGRREAAGAHAGRARKMLDTPADKLTPEQAEKRYAAPGRRSTSPIAKWPSGSPASSRRTRTRRCSWPTRSSDQHRQLQFTINYKRDANYDYWQTGPNSSKRPTRLTARELMFDARTSVPRRRPAEGQEALSGRLRQVAAGDR